MNANDAEAFILDLYRHLLRRTPKSAELSKWVGLLQRGASSHAVFKRFVASLEYQAKNSTVSTMFPPGHYHSPVVDPATVKEYVASSSSIRVDDIAGIEISADRMRKFWGDNLDFIRRTPFPEERSPDFRFRYEGSPFPYGDAIILRAMLHAKRPARVIEIGSGFSTACMLDSADEIGLRDLAVTCIEPYPTRLKSLLREADLKRIEFIERPVQTVPVGVFQRLGAGDILLIDSTHVLKTGSDVHYELFSVLPCLAPGVVIHFHDCQYPFEYPGKWIFELNYSWNEIYAVRAFLMYNNRFGILFWNSFFARQFRSEVARDYPAFLKNSGSSLWIEAL
jgi:predicted O-methyltransferase YrrM